MYFHLFSLWLVISSFEICTCKRSKRVRRIVGGEPADIAPYDDPVAYVRYGERVASVRGVLDLPHYSFRGIRYGYSPTKADRFQRPTRYLLEGNYNATEYPPPCLQPNPDTQEIIGAEDCLFLNVYTPNLPDGSEGLPVILWIHGGGFRYGSASQYGAKHLLKKRMLVVAIQYRLGTLGFLSTGKPDFPGNVGLFDMAAAIEWTKNYISFFGGNSNKIVVMGQGSGASSALLLTLSNIAKGIPCAAVAMSGSAISNWAIDKTPSNTAKDVAEFQGCPTDDVVKMIKCLQKVDGEAIIKGDTYLESTRLKERGFLSGLSGLLSPSPVTEGENDGRSLPAAIQRQPMDDLNAGRRPNIPLLTGVTKDETKKAIYNEYKDEIISQLKSIPEFLDKVFVENLLPLMGFQQTREENILGPLNPMKLGYGAQLTADAALESLGKVSEATGDVLFNLPASLTANLWSKNNTPTYLYRFEHLGNFSKGNVFLKGLPLVSNNKNAVNTNDSVSHGDDLAYLFEARNLDGTPRKDQEIQTEDDEKVRDIFTQMISDFANQGNIRVQNQFLPSFTDAANNFIEISAKPRISNQFRYCEMGLWMGLENRLNSASCQFLDRIRGAILSNVPSSFPQALPVNSSNSLALPGGLNPFQSQSKPAKTVGNWIG